MRLLILVLASFLSSLSFADDPNEVRYFVLTVAVIHEGKAVETREMWDTNWNRDVPGEHVVRMDTTKYELYDGRRISVVVLSDGVVKSADGSRTLKAWKLVPDKPVKLH